MQIAKSNWQQGDVVATRIQNLPPGDVQVIGQKRLVVMHGEKGHSHTIEDDEAELLRIGDRLILRLEKQATIRHEEHKPITMEPGLWDVGQVVEYDWLTRMTRPVID